MKGTRKKRVLQYIVVWCFHDNHVNQLYLFIKVNFTYRISLVGFKVKFYFFQLKYCSEETYVTDIIL